MINIHTDNVSLYKYMAFLTNKAAIECTEWKTATIFILRLLVKYAPVTYLSYFL